MPSAVAQFSAAAFVPRLMLRSIVALALMTPPARFRLPARPLPMIATQLRVPGVASAMLATPSEPPVTAMPAAPPAASVSVSWSSANMFSVASLT